MNVFYICIGLLGVLSLLLGVLVTIGRGKFNVLIGHSNDPENTLHKFVRAHSNTAEYAPLLMVIIYLLSLNPVSNWVWWFIILVTACRFLFVAGILIPKTMAKPNPMRFIGAVGTYVFGLGLCFELFQHAINV
ncbi:MAG: hypothetical protein COA75_14850 [Cellvibrionales bacterium]|nr:MAG: hypothetical protein COA75_14850 [Cellvibrionales bacterium]